MAKVLNYEEFKGLARKNYTLGGAEFFDMWDEGYFNYMSEELGGITKTRAKKLFRKQFLYNRSLLTAAGRIFARR